MRLANCTRQARGRRTSERRRSFVRFLCRRLTMYMAFAKLHSRILAAAEAVQAAKPHSEMPPEQQANMLSAGGPGTGTCWTAMHKSPTELAQSVQRRMATALRLGATPGAGPRSTCALRKGNDGDMYEQSLAGAPFPPVLLRVRGSQDQTAPCGPTPCAGSLHKHKATHTWNAMSLSSTTG